MIKRITLKNFEAHEDSTIEFSDGLNLIIGQSNQGKSSIVRALSLVVANRFEHDSVRTGAQFCTVKVETDKGSITAERGEDINHWIIETPKGKKEYRNIGLSVPPEALEILGMGERVRGEIKELPNIMFQLEKHYMLSEIDGKKTTANSIARMMDEAIGIGGMEELIKDIAADFTSKKKELGTRNIQISELKGKILDFSIFEDYRKSIESARKAYDEVETLEKLMKDAYSISDRLDKNKVSIAGINARLEKSEGIKELSDVVTTQINKYLLLKRAIELVSSINGIEERINICNGIIDFDEDIKKIESCKSSITNASQMLRTARELYKKIRSISNRIINSEKELSLKEQELSIMKAELGECPLCGSRF